jgi:hypothetical protein
MPITITPDKLTTGERILLGEYICQTNDGSMFMSSGEFGAHRLSAMRLEERGIIEIGDMDAIDVSLELTDEGVVWVRSLPQGALAR